MISWKPANASIAAIVAVGDVLAGGRMAGFREPPAGIVIGEVGFDGSRNMEHFV
jgi:hypothetical protein